MRKTDYLSRKIEDELFLLRLSRLRPLDDDFMRVLFKDNIELAQMHLRIILNDLSIEVKSVETQYDMKRLDGGKSLILDVLIIDTKNRVYNIEIQRAKKGAEMSRAERHFTALADEFLKNGNEFETCPGIFVIFITEKDIFKIGNSKYVFDKKHPGTGHVLKDSKEHIVFVNGAYEGNDDIGNLMHDYRCSDPEEMIIQEMRETAKFYKTTKEGKINMCEIMDEIRDEGIKIGEAKGIKIGEAKGIKIGKQEGIKEIRIQSIRSLMERFGFTVIQAMDFMKIPESEREFYSKLI